MKTRALSILFLWPILMQAQTQVPAKYPAGEFRYPMDLAPAVAGSFGDFRPNHFHSGLDFRTNQREGYPVYAVADAYVSRLRVQIGGFGQAIYLDHPNGYTSVYAHLKAYSPEIAAAVKKIQYEKESFEVDSVLIRQAIKVKKGDLIGWSGNTGSSGGPHLHFEIRDTQTEEIINPQLFGFSIPDKVKPEIQGIYLYKIKGQPFGEQTAKQYFPVKKISGNYQLVNNSPIVLNGESGFGIVAFDRYAVQAAAHGLYQISLSLDGETIYTSTWERFSFDHTKAVNAHLDYNALKSSGLSIQKSFVEPGNPLGLYTAVNQGLIRLSDGEIHQLTYTLSDVAGNTSTLNFSVKGSPAQLVSSVSNKQAFTYDADNHYDEEQIKICIPKGSLYS
ncbi:MAG: M23 family metallopeptidase, partial [Sphingobacteriaceae bacterium]